jgi:hypothetical protein
LYLEADQIGSVTFERVPIEAVCFG